MKLMSIFLLLFQGPTFSSSDLYEVRELYEKAAKDEDHQSAFEEYLEKTSGNQHNTLSGYRAVAKVFSARNGWNPISKLSSFRAGSEELDQVISQDVQNLELRYLRYAIQMNAPQMLGYNNNLQEDRAFLLSHWEDCKDLDLKKRIAHYMIEFSNLTPEEKRIFNSTNKSHQNL